VIRAVLDTNTIVSGVGWGGSPGAVLDAALAGRFEMVTSPSLLDELRRVLSYPKLQAVIGGADELTELLALASVVINPTETVAVSRDPDDDRLIEAALAANADVIVTCRQLVADGLVPVWGADAHNTASLRTAARLGFREVSRRTYLVRAR